jgi:RND superfamily putative drug exporter
VLFGLSMDYEVYLVSRIQEEWHHLHHTRDIELAALAGRAARRNHQAVTVGQAKSGEIIAAGEQPPQQTRKTEGTRSHPAKTAK